MYVQNIRGTFMDYIKNTVDKYRELILKAERSIWATPETGFKEFKTSAYLAKEFEALGYSLTYAQGITGFYTDIDTGIEGPTILILSELDSVICASHKESDPKTGAVHACGHNAQCATLLGIAAALKNKEILNGLCGKIRLCAVPAEECLEIEYRLKLRDEGKIKHLGGKSEFLSRGYFDGCDIAFMVHQNCDYRAEVSLGGDSGFIAKTIVYKGVSAHAACGAYAGKNALYAAMAGLNSVNALRETFREDPDRIRWHPIITHGGDIVNNIPERVVIESQIRAANYTALVEQNKKIDRALIGAAISFGVEIEIHDEPGYAPLKNSPEFALLAKGVYEELFPGDVCNVRHGVGSGCTDMGDLSMLMPVIHPYVSGTVGKGHGDDFYITDPDHACLDSAKWQLGILKKLLINNGEEAYRIIKSFTPEFKSKEDFLSSQNGLLRNEGRVIYNNDGSVIMKG